MCVDAVKNMRCSETLVKKTKNEIIDWYIVLYIAEYKVIQLRKWSLWVNKFSNILHNGNIFKNILWNLETLTDCICAFDKIFSPLKTQGAKNHKAQNFIIEAV